MVECCPNAQNVWDPVEITYLLGAPPVVTMKVQTVLTMLVMS